jgi:hypothetical protein
MRPGPAKACHVAVYTNSKAEFVIVVRLNSSPLLRKI